ncbi:MAG: low specificity L-threonine aldolase [Bacteroidales bacterium]|nr:low specificity L-threonine aldolase [Bacteroidales bacterium]
MKIHFETDYMAGTHPEILQRLIETNLEETEGYGSDEYTKRAEDLIKKACGKEDARVHFLVGGTQTNSTVIDGLLARHEGVLTAESGHINVHESGAIESCGHKVLTLPQEEGKIKAEDIEKYISNFYADDTYLHMVAPGMVYISFPTEYGAVYSKKELQNIQSVCRKWEIPLYIDGARLGYGLVAENSDVTLQDIAQLADVFYIGGTKLGALFGEAVVVSNPKLLKNFFPLIKQHGALLAKGRLLGLQFETLFSNNLYERVSRHAVKMAMKIKQAFIEKGYMPIVNSTTNQQFFRLPNEVIDKLSENVGFEYWGARGEKESEVRFVTSWATKEEDVDLLIERLNF